MAWFSGPGEPHRYSTRSPSHYSYTSRHSSSRWLYRILPSHNQAQNPPPLRVRATASRKGFLDDSAVDHWWRTCGHSEAVRYTSAAKSIKDDGWSGRRQRGLWGEEQWVRWWRRGRGYAEYDENCADVYVKPGNDGFPHHGSCEECMIAANVVAICSRSQSW